MRASEDAFRHCAVAFQNCNGLAELAKRGVGVEVEMLAERPAKLDGQPILGSEHARRYGYCFAHLLFFLIFNKVYFKSGQTRFCEKQRKKMRENT